ncbi:uncharacterized protein ACIB01_013043 isoform 1-T1 [Guaruba guarouba]
MHRPEWQRCPNRDMGPMMKIMLGEKPTQGNAAPGGTCAIPSHTDGASRLRGTPVPLPWEVTGISWGELLSSRAGDRGCHWLPCHPGSIALQGLSLPGPTLQGKQLFPLFFSSPAETKTRATASESMDGKTGGEGGREENPHKRTALEARGKDKKETGGCRGRCGDGRAKNCRGKRRQPGAAWGARPCHAYRTSAEPPATPPRPPRGMPRPTGTQSLVAAERTRGLCPPTPRAPLLRPHSAPTRVGSPPGPTSPPRRPEE